MNVKTDVTITFERGKITITGSERNPDLIDTGAFYLQKYIDYMRAARVAPANPVQHFEYPVTPVVQEIPEDLSPE